MMLVDRHRPLFAAEVEGGTPETQEPAGGAPPPPPPREQESPQREGPGSGRSDIRKQLEKGFEDQRKAQAPPGREDRGRDRKTGQYASRQRREAEAAGETPGEGAEGAAEGETETPAEEVPAPEAWSREAKAEWANVPPQVQQAVIKREQDVAKGVEQLRANYKDIDAALASRLDLVRQTGHTPAQAVNQLFLWFEALNADAMRIRAGQPAQAFPALAQSFGLDPRQVYPYPAQPQAQPQQSQPAAQPGEAGAAMAAPDAVPPHLQKWFGDQMAMLVNAMGQKFGGIEQAMQQQGLAKANEVIDIWSKDKPYFPEVRMAMAQLLQNGMVPALPNGNADLDKAYDMALYALPEVRAKVLADQQKAADTQRKAKEAAERKAQQEQADKARRAAVALGPSSPGAEVRPERKRGKTVRESLQEAIEEASGARR